MKTLIILTILLAFIVSACSAQIKKDTSVSIYTDSISTATTHTNVWIQSYRFPKYYTVDWSKIKSFSDFKAVMMAINIYVSDNSTDFKKIKKYLKPYKQ